MDDYLRAKEGVIIEETARHLDVLPGAKCKVAWLYYQYPTPVSETQIVVFSNVYIGVETEIAKWLKNRKPVDYHGFSV